MLRMFWSLSIFCSSNLQFLLKRGDRKACHWKIWMVSSGFLIYINGGWAEQNNWHLSFTMESAAVEGLIYQKWKLYLSHCFTTLIYVEFIKYSFARITLGCLVQLQVWSEKWLGVMIAKLGENKDQIYHISCRQCRQLKKATCLWLLLANVALC